MSDAVVDFQKVRTIKQFAEEAGPAITEGKLRAWIFKRRHNGIGSCLIKIGGRYYLDPDAFARWLESQREDPAAA